MQTVADVQVMLKDYFDVYVPTEYLQNLIDLDEEFQEILMNDAVRDTMDRDYIIGELLRSIEVRVWPMYGEGSEVMPKFLNDLGVALKSIGGHFIGDAIV